jgi:hypothetical protein
VKLWQGNQIMTILQTLLANGNDEQRKLIARHLGWFPLDHPIREHLLPYPDLAALANILTPCETAKIALSKIRSRAVSWEEPWQHAIADAICDEIVPRREQPAAVTDPASWRRSKRHPGRRGSRVSGGPNEY